MKARARSLILLLLVSGCARESETVFANVSVTLPEDKTTLPPGPHAELATQNCMACHSADMILNQPRLTRTQWTANVEKMVKVYKANIDAKDVPQIVDYLVATNARLTPQAKTAP
jgi:hypothetical protein